MKKSGATKLHGKRCRCPRCGETFSTVSNFDRHLGGKPGVTHCVPPEQAGLVKTTYKDGDVWKMPGIVGAKHYENNV